MEENFGECKLWQNGKENTLSGINFGGFMMKVQLSAYKNRFEFTLVPKFSICNFHVFASQMSDVR